MEAIKEKFDEFIKSFLSLEWLWNVLQSIVNILLVIAVCYIVYRLVVFLLTKYVSLVRGDLHKKRARTINNLIRSFMRYVFLVIAIIFSLQFLGLDPATIFAGAGVVGIVIGFAFQDLLKDIVAGFFIIIEKSYNVGDLVEIDGNMGTITNIGIKTTTFEAYTGEIIIINNRDVSKIVNYTTTSHAIVISQISISFANSLNHFVDIFNRNLEEFRKKFPYMIADPAIKGITGFDNIGYIIEIHTKVRPLTQFAFKREFNMELLRLCKENNIVRAVPYMEGKTEAGDNNDNDTSGIQS